MLDYNITLTNTLVSLTKDACRITYTKEQVKSWACYLAAKNFFWDTFGSLVND